MNKPVALICCYSWYERIQIYEVYSAYRTGEKHL
jgi:hypothetical protein